MIKYFFFNKPFFAIRTTLDKMFSMAKDLRAVLCKNQTKWEMKNFEPPTQIYMEVGPHEGCSKMSIIEAN